MGGFPVFWLVNQEGVNMARHRGIILSIAIILLATNVLGQGTVLIDQIDSATLGEVKDVRVYVPEGYDPDLSAGYPVVYYLHGANSNCLDPFNDFVFEVLDELIGHPDPGPAIQPMVLVMPDGSALPYAGSMWANSDLYGDYEDFVVNDVTQYAEENYNIRMDASGTGITGYSMGEWAP